MYTSNQFEMDSFSESKSAKREVDLVALKQKTMNELNKLEKEEETGVFHLEEEDSSEYSIEEKENISK